MKYNNNKKLYIHTYILLLKSIEKKKKKSQSYFSSIKVYIFQIDEEKKKASAKIRNWTVKNIYYNIMHKQKKNITQRQICMIMCVCK